MLLGTNPEVLHFRVFLFLAKEHAEQYNTYMHEAIIQFANQLPFKPKLEHGHVAYRGGPIIVSGMGGSNLSSGLLKYYDPTLEIYIHRTYGLPKLHEEVLRSALLIASSYSGNTEETIDFVHEALGRGLRPVVIASGGKLIALAEEERLPFIVLPDDIIQPRVALGVSLIALATVSGQHALLKELEKLGKTLDPVAQEREGKALAEALHGHIPLIYTASEHEALAYIWKIKMNETAKTPAFMNLFPELNHNEMTGFSGKGPKAPFKLLYLESMEDSGHLRKRMQVTADLYSSEAMGMVSTKLLGTTRIERAMRSLLVADFTAYHLALMYNVDPAGVPVVEEFKRRIAR